MSAVMLWLSGRIVWDDFWTKPGAESGEASVALILCTVQAVGAWLGLWLGLGLLLRRRG